MVINAVEEKEARKGLGGTRGAWVTAVSRVVGEGPPEKGHCHSTWRKFERDSRLRTSGHCGQICSLAVTWRMVWKGRLEARRLEKRLLEFRRPTDEVTGDGSLDYGARQWGRAERGNRGDEGHGDGGLVSLGRW